MSIHTDAGSLNVPPLRGIPGPSSGRLETSPLLASEVSWRSDGYELSEDDREFDHAAQHTPTTNLASGRRLSDSYSRYHRFRIRLRYYVPVFGWLPKYHLQYLQGDVIAGITVAFLLVPQGLSYAQALVKIPPVHGLYTACIPVFIYALFGTSRQLGMGPEALISMLVGATIRDYASSKGSPRDGIQSYEDVLASQQAEAIGIAALLGLMVGIFTFLLGCFRLGFLDSVLSRALLRGFVLAVAVVVMIDMSETLLGIVPPKNQCGSVDPSPPSEKPGENESPIHKLLDTLSKLSHTHMLTAVLSGCSITFLLGMKLIKAKYRKVRWLQVVPEILVLVVVTTALSKIFSWDCSGVAILNVAQSNSSKYDYPKFPPMSLNKIKSVLLSAILISVIGFVESIVAAKTYANKRNYSVSPNRELVAFGVSNIIGGVFGAFPAFGSLGRSAVNDTAGAKTQMAGFVTGSAVLCTIIWLLPYFEHLPKAVCSSIIVVAALKLVELEDVHFIIRMRAWKDLGLLLMTFVTTILLSIESGTLLSVGVSLLLVVKHTTKTRLAIMGRILVVDPHTGRTKIKYRNIGDSDKVQRIDDVLIIRVEEGLFFGNSGQLKDRLKRIELYGDLGVHPGEEPRRALAGRRRSRASSQEPSSIEEGLGAASKEAPMYSHVRAVVFDFGAVTAIDASATLTLLEIVEDYSYRNMEVCFVKLRESCKNAFLRSGIYDIVGPHRFFRKVRDATHYLKALDGIDPSSPSTTDHLILSPLITDEGLFRHSPLPANIDAHATKMDVDPINSHAIHEATEWTVPDKRAESTFPTGSYFASYMEDAPMLPPRPQSRATDYSETYDDDDDLFGEYDDASEASQSLKSPAYGTQQKQQQGHGKQRPGRGSTSSSSSQGQSRTAGGEFLAVNPPARSSPRREQNRKARASPAEAFDERSAHDALEDMFGGVGISAQIIAKPPIVTSFVSSGRGGGEADLPDSLWDRDK
ncbi:sulfate transporter family-domain-containing protein [Fimicolochytrium jonesii]|uniref:sulfate transporter family-domain-containing protein n=1 Tax=Fimicolochytrium jonesii TaxID=1396493 RepID=UPI0022FECE75|nr:sulfate transporter family-domain-containing protein [Fimicolochytrium jonesii]KAI8825815.1 sulfate transporter family-domain-containing protein [Fimicolochytrium jonesii]